MISKHQQSTFCDQNLQFVDILQKTLKMFIFVFFFFFSTLILLFFQNIFQSNIPLSRGFSTKLFAINKKLYFKKELQTLKCFCVRHKNRLKHNQCFKVPFLKKTLLFGK